MDILINYLSTTLDLSISETVLLERSFFLLMCLPIVTTIAGTFRYIVGLKTLNVYTPVILTFAFYDLGFIITGINSQGYSEPIRGLIFGILMYLIVFIATTLVYSILKKFRMHYIPKSSLILIAVSVAIILSIFFGTLILNKKGLIYLNAIPIIVISVIAEALMSNISRKGVAASFSTALQTLLIAVISYIIISLDMSQRFILDNSILILLGLVLLNIVIGTFSGLRLNEYWRFRTLIFKDYGDAKPKKSPKK